MGSQFRSTQSETGWFPANRLPGIFRIRFAQRTQNFKRNRSPLMLINRMLRTAGVWFLALWAPIGWAQESPAELLKKSQADLLSGDYASARDQCARAAAAFHSSGDQANEARALTGQGLARLYSGDYKHALENFNEAISISRAIHDYPGEITRLNNAGTAYYYLGRYADAMNTYTEAQRVVSSHPEAPWNAAQRQLTMGNVAMLHQTVGQYERALDIYSDLLRSQQALPPRERAQFLNNVGSLRRRLGDPQKALETYREAQAIYTQASHSDGEIAILNNIAIVQAMDLRDYPAAIASFSKALELALGSRNTPLAVHARLYRGETFYRAGRIAESRADLESALKDAERLGEQEESWKALYGMARAAFATGDDGSAGKLLRRALAIIEALRQNLSGTTLKSDFLAGKREVYDLLIEHTADPRDVFRLMEQSRTRDIRDRLGISPQLDLDRFAAGVPRDEAVLEYWVGGTSAAVLAITSGRYQLKRFRLTPENVKDLESYPAVLADSHQQNWSSQASRIAGMLLFDSSLAGEEISSLKILADGPIARIPFETLPFANSLTVQRFTISYSPSASLIRPGTTARIVWPWQILLKAIADPAPMPDAENRSIAAGWQRLPEAAGEASSVARVLGGKSLVYIGAEALKSRLIDRPIAPLIHIASHALADPADPDRSYIVFAQPTKNPGYDYLYRRELFDLNMRAVDLAVLSSCETAAGKFVAGEGIQSFTGAFLAAGAHAVAASLWKVDDKATSELMVRFYAQLREGKTKAEALRNAKLAFLRSSTAAHPAYWAAFILTGEGRARVPYIVRWWQLIASALLLAGVVGTVVRVSMRGRKESR